MLRPKQQYLLAAGPDLSRMAFMRLVPHFGPRPQNGKHPPNAWVLRSEAALIAHFACLINIEGYCCGGQIRSRECLQDLRCIRACFGGQGVTGL
ncbi:hypothetical protein N7457_002293 [Penicillium paradoxum]|uniref:uncharacterized protein n=1 Tax=Penicillium paradoxum TaxID=176176 RepID=UPI002546C607|nr:uncharacterized protein N7457_002293 [Penicillium paradoxum]KAJ5787303.1 hypothetical protein N7457_002293 [Penicillium paradoxum]